jgi:hypothetical protein
VAEWLVAPSLERPDVRANWHQNSVALMEGDPFEAQPQLAASVDPTSPAHSSQTMTIGSQHIPMKPISLDTPVAELRDDLRSLLRREARLFDAGMTCDLKDAPDMNCLACPVSQADNPDVPKCALCRIGQAQEVTLATLLAAERRQRGD